MDTACVAEFGVDKEIDDRTDASELKEDDKKTESPTSKTVTFSSKDDEMDVDEKEDSDIVLIVIIILIAVIVLSILIMVITHFVTKSNKNSRIIWAKQRENIAI